MISSEIPSEETNRGPSDKSPTKDILKNVKYANLKTIELAPLHLLIWEEHNNRSHGHPMVVSARPSTLEIPDSVCSN